MNDLNNNEEITTQIRKFLKQVGVGSHQLIENEIKNNNSNRFDISIKLEINNKGIKEFETIIKK
ncbi:MAG: hypothetical protein CFH34_01316 [Alphaproteobacteria bacterium MarineAlpha9_Bin4]|nr:hypothetical protein [Pelagibacterales bacterium]PPR25716.1 MAG: hypothetical protein CFH34_01316 [Alphaproteobacteria bacterium MarineAlpha9_Bin4]|tara:strand:+ start:667 stop:858 length:192 start_codon:yes stop_codon:yes gene_type:complete